MSTALRISIGTFLSLGAIFWIGGTLAPSNYVVERTIHIKAEPSRISSFVSDFSTWEKWSPWKDQDPEAVTTVSGTAGEPGHKLAWQGKKIGEGSMILARVNPGIEVASQLVFVSPRMMSSEDAFFLTPASDGSTRVIWRNHGNLLTRSERWIGLLFLDRMIGKDYESGLVKLKMLLENSPAL